MSFKLLFGCLAVLAIFYCPTALAGQKLLIDDFSLQLLLSVGNFTGYHLTNFSAQQATGSYVGHVLGNERDVFAQMYMGTSQSVSAISISGDQFSVENYPHTAIYASIVWDGPDNSNTTATNLLNVNLTLLGGFAFHFFSSTDISTYWQIYVYPHGGSLATAAYTTFFVPGDQNQTFHEYYIPFQTFTNYQLSTFQNAGAIEFFADGGSDVNQALTLVEVIGYDINGYVTLDCSGIGAHFNGTNGIAGITVTLTNVQTNSVFSTNVTNSQGFFTLTGPPANNTVYEVCLVYGSNYVSTAVGGANCFTITLLVGLDFSGLNFTLAAVPVLVAPANKGVACGTNITIGAPGFTNPTITNGLCPYTLTSFDSTTGTSCTTVDTRTWTAVSIPVNVFSVSVSQVITITDTAAPSFVTFPSNYTTTCGSDTSAASAGSPTVLDACQNGANTFLNSIDITTRTACPLIFQRQWTTSDICGNAQSRNQSITVTDTVKPVFQNFPANFSGECLTSTNIGITGAPTATDSCSAPTVNYTTSAGTGNSCKIVYTRTFFATDACGNQVSQAQTITLTDDIAPVISQFPSSPLNLNCGSNTSVIYTGLPVATDNCNTVSITKTDFFVNTTCVTTITRVFVVSDSCGNAQTFNQTIILSDIQGPLFTFVPASQTTACTNLNTSNLSVFGNASATDCVLPVTITPTFSDNGNVCNRVITRTFVAADQCGNSNSTTQVITFNNVNPSFTTFPNNYNTACNNSYLPTQAGSPTITTFCGTSLFSLFYNDSIGVSGCNQTVSRVWSAVDSCGDLSTRTQLIFLIDSVPPYFSFFPANYSGQCGTNVSNLAITGSPVVSHPCNTVTLSYSYSTTQSGNGCNTVYNRTFIGRDSCGNTVTQSQSLFIVDTTAPTIVSVPNNQTNLPCGSNTSVAILGQPSAIDNCNSVVISNVDSTTSTTCLTTILRNFTVADVCGNAVSYIQSITVSNSQKPFFASVPSGQTNPCNTQNANLTVYGTPIVVDCQLTPTITYTFNTTVLNCVTTVIRTFTASDVCGNTNVAYQTLIFTDIPPFFTNFPPTALVNCSSPRTPSVTGTPIGNSNCYNGSVSTSFSDSALGPGCSQIITRTWTVSDGCNSANQNQFINVTDPTPPTFTTFPSNVSNIQCGGSTSASLTGTPTASDVCGNAVTISSTDQFGPINSCNQIIYRTWSAANPCGIATTRVQQLNVVDTAAPVFLSVPSNVNVSCLQQTTPNVTGIPTFRDCQSNPQFFYNDTTTVTTCVTTIVRVFTVYDGCGNSNTTTQTIIQSDSFGASFTNFPADRTLQCGSSTTVASLGTPGGSNLCGLAVTIAHTDISVNASTCNTVIERQWSAADSCGATIYQNQSITLFDHEAPTFSTFPADVTLPCGSSTAISNTGTPTFTDDCSALNPLNHNDVVSNSACKSVTSRTFIISDICGNVASRTQTITVTYNATITLLTTPQAVYNLQCGSNTSVAVLGTITASDACLPLTISSSDVTVGNGCSRSIARTFTASDGCNVPATFLQTINLNDTTAPVLSIPATANVTCDSSRSPTQTGQATATDNCNPVQQPIGFVDVSNGVACTPTYTRVWTASDVCGNSVTKNQTILTYNPYSPVFQFFPNNVSTYCGNNTLSLTGTPTATDACGTLSPVSSGDSPFGNSCNGGTNRLWTQCDSCGRCTSRTQSITIFDNVGPVFTTFPPNSNIYQCNQNTAVNPSSGTQYYPTAQDACNAVASIAYVDSVPANPGCNYTVTRTWTTTDSCGNPTVKVQTYGIVDTVLPVFHNFPADVAIPCQVGLSTSPSSTGIPTASDVCDPNPTITHVDVNLNPRCPSGITIQRTWTVKDACGNTYSQVQLVNVTLSTPPLVIPADRTQNCDVSTNPSTTGSATSVSPCNLTNVVTYSDAVQPGSCPEIILRTWTAKDPCGNTATGIQQITLADLEPPFFSYFPADVKIGCADCTTPNCTGLPIASDLCNNLLCGVDSFDYYLQGAVEPGACVPDVIIVREFTVTDNCGNAVSKNQTITIANEQFSGNCPQQNCAPQPCTGIECPTIINVGCDCCAQGGIKACNPVPCTPVACEPVQCNAVPCTPCKNNNNNNNNHENYYNNQINNEGVTIVVNNTNPPICDSSVEVPCVPQIVYVVRSNSTGNGNTGASPSPSPIAENQSTRNHVNPSAGSLIEASPILLAVALVALVFNFFRFN